MILCKQKDLHRYFGINRNLDTALNYILGGDLSALKMGKNNIDGDAVYVNRFDYDTVTEPITEGHLLYADVHVVLEGEEIVAVADTSELTEIFRDEAADDLHFEGYFQSLNTLRPGDVLIVFPEDAHSPKRISGETSCRVKKAVIKVRVKE